MKSISGTPASYGIAIGPAYVFNRVEIVIKPCNIQEPEAELKRFAEARETTHQQLDEAYLKAKEDLGEEAAEIFSAQKLMLEDPELLTTVKSRVESELINVETALFEAAENYAQQLEAIEDEYLSARALDIRDVSSRCLRNLLGLLDSPAAGLKTPSIIVSHDLTPSDTVLLDKEYVLGFCTAEGGSTSHTAILARGLGIPAVVGAGQEVEKINTGDDLVIDGDAGKIVIDPDNKALKDFKERQVKFLKVQAEAEAISHQPAITSDGHQVEVVANIGSEEGILPALAAGAEGVGLLRSEFLYLERSSLPTEEEQYQSYKAIADAFGDKPVILRSLDVGGDKDIPYIEMPPEANPFLGVRAIRLCLSRPDIFKPQLRAALRAGYGNNLKLMFPMVATIDDVMQTREVLEECRVELKKEGFDVADEMDIGIMIEIPSAAIMADQLSEVVDFFSIGTNDLSQYTLAADRTNAQVAPIASGFQPAVFRLIKGVIDAAHANGKWVGLCGEMAGELLAIPILLGLGLDEFSMNPPAIPFAKQLIRSISFEHAQLVAQTALNLRSDNEIREYVQNMVPEVNIG
ncbi:MAG: phosphoenolpyruvate--protein phosphotransferase [Anaerolineales bacterium]|nr:phosphoenolpyruvate--protein phosphotransferase [Anaerolineales bacterium]